MSKFEEDGVDTRNKDESLDDLWGAEGGSEASVVHDSDEPGFDNSEARDTLSESLEDPVDAIPREPEGDPEAAPKKSSSLPFYGAVGAFVLVAVGLVAYKTGLVGGSSRKPMEPVVSAMASDTVADKAKKPDSLMDAPSSSQAPAPDLFGESGAKARPSFDAEADLLADKVPAPAATPIATAVSAAVEVAQAAPKAADAAPAVVAQAPAVAPAPAPAPASAPAPVAPAREQVTAPPAAPAAPAPAEVAKAAPKAQTPAATTVAKADGPKPAKRVREASAPKVQAAARAPTPRVVADKPARIVRLADARKPPKGSGKGRRGVEKDATPEAKEQLTGWKLRGTWPNHGPSQLAWVADEQGRLMTVSVGETVAGARVLSIGKRGEVVQTTAGQILP